MDLRELRESKLLTQADVSRATGLSEGQLSKIENGHNKPRASTIRALAEAMGVEPNVVLRASIESQQVGEMA